MSTNGRNDGDRAPEQAVPQRRGLNRRQFLEAAAAVGVAGGGLGALLANSPAARAAAPTGLTYTIADLKHVVIFMQENRSYDHYFGTMYGARGFGDKQQLVFQDGTNVFQQADASRSDGGTLLPFRLDSATVNALGVGSLDHGWTSYHEMWNTGGYNKWVPAKTQMCMGYYAEDDLPFQYALAQAFTVCDQYHCSMLGPTHPNRLWNWTGTIDPAGTGGGPIYDNSQMISWGFTWETFSEMMQNAGVDWGTYTNQYPDGGFTGSWENNDNIYFAAYKAAAQSSNAAVQELASRADIHFSGNTQTYPASAPPSDYETNLDWVLSDFINDCANDTLPSVAWMVAPENWSEHPAVGDRGAYYVGAVVQALASNPDVWNSTLLIINYDEADGMFDHVPPPFPEPGTENEFLPTQGSWAAGHIGPGPRVPTMLVSPWTRGGRSYSGVMDHTSVHQFIEYWMQETQGITFSNTNISPWRRQIMNNLLGALDFENPDFSVPTLPDTAPILTAFTLDESLPAAAPPPVGQQSMPVPSASGAAVTPMPSPYQQHADVAIDRGTGAVTATMTNAQTPAGLSTGVCHQVYPDQFSPFEATPFTVMPGTPRTYIWDATKTGGQYAFSIYGPDRFVRRFAGTVVPTDESLAGVGVITTALQPGTTPTFQITLSNAGMGDLEFTLTPNDYEGATQTVFVAPGASQAVSWPVDQYGFYDVIVTDSSDTGLSHRYAGRIN